MVTIAVVVTRMIASITTVAVVVASITTVAVGVIIGGVTHEEVGVGGGLDGASVSLNPARVHTGHSLVSAHCGWQLLLVWSVRGYSVEATDAGEYHTDTEDGEDGEEDHNSDGYYPD